MFALCCSCCWSAQLSVSSYIEVRSSMNWMFSPCPTWSKVCRGRKCCWGRYCRCRHHLLVWKIERSFSKCFFCVFGTCFCCVCARDFLDVCFHFVISNAGFAFVLIAMNCPVAVGFGLGPHFWDIGSWCGFCSGACWVQVVGWAPRRQNSKRIPQIRSDMLAMLALL